MTTAVFLIKPQLKWRHSESHSKLLITTCYCSHDYIHYGDCRYKLEYYCQVRLWGGKLDFGRCNHTQHLLKGYRRECWLQNGHVSACVQWIHCPKRHTWNPLRSNWLEAAHHQLLASVLQTFSPRVLSNSLAKGPTFKAACRLWGNLTGLSVFSFLSYIHLFYILFCSPRMVCVYKLNQKLWNQRVQDPMSTLQTFQNILNCQKNEKVWRVLTLRLLYIFYPVVCASPILSSWIVDHCLSTSRLSPSHSNIDQWILCTTAGD